MAQNYDVDGLRRLGIRPLTKLQKDLEERFLCQEGVERDETFSYLREVVAEVQYQREPLDVAVYEKKLRGMTLGSLIPLAESVEKEMVHSETKADKRAWQDKLNVLEWVITEKDKQPPTLNAARLKGYLAVIRRLDNAELMKERSKIEQAEFDPLAKQKLALIGEELIKRSMNRNATPGFDADGYKFKLKSLSAEELMREKRELNSRNGELSKDKEVVVKSMLLQDEESRRIKYNSQKPVSPPPPPPPVPSPAGITATAKRWIPPSPPQPAQPTKLTQPGENKKLTMPTEPPICFTCPNYSIFSLEQQSLFGKDMGIAMCGVFKIPLDTLNSSEEQSKDLQRKMAGTCPEYGKKVKEPIYLGQELTLRIAEKREKHELTGDHPEACSSCTFYMTPETMMNSYGIPQAACSYTGKLIELGKGKETATQCTQGVVDFEHTEAKKDPLKKRLLYPYRGNITIIDDESVSSIKMELHPDPTNYQTDKEVTDEDKSFGIRAWRELKDPDKDSNHTVFMPIFDPEFFSEEERSKIPTAGKTQEDDHPELYEDHLGLLYTATVLWLQLHETPALNGVAGTGKTEFFRYAAWQMQLPFERFSITNSTELDELQGRFVLENGETVFKPGRVSRAWGKPCVLAIDEPNTGPNDVWQFFRPLTDNSKQLVLDVNNGERLPRHKYTMLGMAFNPAWDMRNVGTHEISDADGSRLMHIAVPMPNEEREKDIIRRRCMIDGYSITDKTLTSIMNIAKELRSLADDDAFPVHWGVRNQIKVARATAWFPLKKAYRLAAGDLLDPQFCDQLMTIVSSHATVVPNLPYSSVTALPNKYTIH